MDPGTKRRLRNGLVLLAASTAGFGSTFRLLVDDLAFPGPGGLLLFASALVGLGLLGVGAASEGRVRVRAHSTVLLTLGILAAGAATSLFVSPSPFRSGAVFFPYAANLLFFFLVLFGGQDREFGKLILKGALGVALVQCALGIYQFYTLPPGENLSTFHGTNLSSSRIAGILAMMIPVAAGLLVNSIHEHMDRSIWPRRILYSVSTVFLIGGLYYTGSEVAWTALAFGLVLALLMVGGTYLGRNRKIVLVVGGVLLLLAAGAATIQTQTTFRIPGYGTLPQRLQSGADRLRENLDTAVDHPLLGTGYDEKKLFLPEAEDQETPGGAPAFSELAALGGFPVAGAFLLFLLGGLTHFWRSRELTPVGKLEARVLVGTRRTLKAIDVTAAGVLGGALAFIAVLILPTPIFPTAFLLLFLPLWGLILTTSFSYKHFRLVVENQRDFVAIGAAAGAAVGTLRSFITGDLTHPPTQFLLLLLLALALSRRARPAAMRVIDFRSPKFVRPLAGLACVLLCLAGLGLALWGFGGELKKTELASPLPEREGLFLFPEVRGPSTEVLRERVRLARRLAETYRVDAHLWTTLGTARLKLLQKELWAGDESAWEAALGESARAFTRARETSRSHRLRGREGWAWLSVALVTHPPSPELLTRAGDAFGEAARSAPRHPAHAAGFGEVLFARGETAAGREKLAEALRLSAEAAWGDRLTPDLARTIRARLRNGR
ncbi:MAG: hypothetical protein ACYS47_16075 [Planctomycetota bacterium]|jgi:hypothetical protein